MVRVSLFSRLAPMLYGYANLYFTVRSKAQEEDDEEEELLKLQAEMAM